MAKSATASLGVIHPASTSRIERAAAALDEKRKQIAQLTEEADALKARLLAMVKSEGEADEQGKVRYETDQHKFTVIGGRNTYANPAKLKIAMTANGITPKVQAKVFAAAVTETEYEYVGVYLKKGGDDAD